MTPSRSRGASTERRSRIAALVVGAACATRGTVGAAHGAAPAPRLAIDGCPGELTSKLAADVKREIDVLLRERATPAAPPEEIQIRCVEARAQIAVAVTLRGARREATVELASLAVEHRARAVGLATAELVQASLNAELAPASVEPEARPAGGAPAIAMPSLAAQPDPIAQTSPQPTRGSRASVAVGGLAQWLGQPAALLLGARMAVHAPLGEVLSAVVSADAGTGKVSTATAEIGVDAFSGGVHLYAGWSARRLRLEAGPGARAGWVRLAGHPGPGITSLEGAELSAAWGGPELRARVAFRPRERSALQLAFELGAGLVARPVRGLRDGTERVHAVEGPWLSLGLELALGVGRGDGG